MTKLQFFSCSSISAWAGKQNGLHFLDGDKLLPYVEKEGLFYYFGSQDDGAYNLIMTSSKDIGE